MLVLQANYCLANRHWLGCWYCDLANNTSWHCSLLNATTPLSGVVILVVSRHLFFLMTSESPLQIWQVFLAQGKIPALWSRVVVSGSMGKLPSDSASDHLKSNGWRDFVLAHCQIKATAITSSSAPVAEEDQAIRQQLDMVQDNGSYTPQQLLAKCLAQANEQLTPAARCGYCWKNEPIKHSHIINAGLLAYPADQGLLQGTRRS